MRQRVRPGMFVLAVMLAGWVGGASLSWAAPSVKKKAHVPQPSEVLGFPLGSRPASHDQIVRYMERLAASSERIVLHNIGRSHEGRRLLTVTISSAANMKRLSEIRKVHQRLGRPVGLSKAEKDKLVNSTPALAWLGYSIHGDEISGSDAVMDVAYRLVTSNDPLIQKMRRELVIQLDPCENPDGRSRYLPMLRAFRNYTSNPNPTALSHTAMWPWGRGNHYLFDLNRDWFSLVHPESQARARFLSQWWPQLVVDAHEMDDNRTFLFSPPREPYNPHLPFYMQRWWKRFASDQGAAFDRKGWGYYRGEWNEELFPGYGSSWPLYGGAISILYEQVSTFGQSIQLRSGLTLTYRESVERQAVSSLANLATLVQNRKSILSDWSEGRRRAMKAKGKMKSFVILPGSDPGRALHFVATLVFQGIEVETNTVDVTVSNAQDFWGTKKKKLKVPAHSYRVRVAQPLGPLVRNLLFFHNPLSRPFLRTERKWLEQGRGSRMYETTAWAMPLAYNVSTYWLGSVPRGVWKPVKISSLRARPGGLSPVVTKKAKSSKAKVFGYVYACDTDAAARLTGMLLQEGFQLRAALDAFTLKGRSFPRGSILLRTRTNKPHLFHRLRAWAKSLGVNVYATRTALSDKGPDLGGNRFGVLLRPKIAVVTGRSVSPTEYGAVWHWLDKRMGLPFAGVPLHSLSNTDLSRYNVIVMPPAEEDAYTKALGTDGVSKLRSWVEAGGSLIALGNASSVLLQPKIRLSQVRMRRQFLSRYPPVVLGPSVLQLDRLSPMRAVGVKPVAPPPKTPWLGMKRGQRGASSRPVRKKALLWKPRKKKKPTHPYRVLPVVGKGAQPFLRAGEGFYKFPKAMPSMTEWMEPLFPSKLSPKAQKRILQWADGRLRHFRPQGAYLRADIASDHWLSFGVPSKLPVHFRQSHALMSEMSIKVVARFAGLKNLHVSGLLWPEAAGRIAKTAYLTRESLGKGQIILFADNPIFRNVTWGTQRLLTNAVLFGPGLGTNWITWRPRSRRRHNH